MWAYMWVCWRWNLRSKHESRTIKNTIMAEQHSCRRSTEQIKRFTTQLWLISPCEGTSQAECCYLTAYIFYCTSLCVAMIYISINGYVRLNIQQTPPHLQPEQHVCVYVSVQCMHIFIFISLFPSFPPLLTLFLFPYLGVNRSPLLKMNHALLEVNLP